MCKKALRFAIAIQLVFVLTSNALGDPNVVSVNLPVGTILPWDPIIRDSNGNKIGERELPANSPWKICDGDNGTIDLSGRFLRGETSNVEAGELGGNKRIPRDGGHYHTGETDQARKNASRANGNHNAMKAHHHDLTTDPVSDHDHGGDNNPEFYSVRYICLTSSALFQGRLPLTSGGTDFQAFYSPVMDLTWTRDASISQSGRLWNNAKLWAESLDIGGVQGWRLPNMDINGNGDIVNCSIVDDAECEDNELGYLFHKLGVTSASPGVFTGIKSTGSYWSSTEVSTGVYARLNFLTGDSNTAGGGAPSWTWAVYKGDVATPVLGCVPKEYELHIEDCYEYSDGDDWSPAVRRAIDSFSGIPRPSTGGTIQFGPRTYTFSETIELDRTVILQGQGAAGSDGATILLFDPDTTGILVHYAMTSSDPVRRGDRSLIKNLTVRSLGGNSGHGIELLARANLEYVSIENFPENGIHISADVNRTPPTNANTWRMYSVLTTENGGHGLYVDGGDTNTGVAVGLSASSNGGWGIYDSSFLGNTYLGAHTATNTLGSYKSDDRNARNLFLNPYAEGDQPPAQIIAPSIVLGGLLELADTCTTDTGTMSCNYAGINASGFITTFPNGARAVNNAGSSQVTTLLGSLGVPGVAYELIQNGEPNWPWRMTFDDTDQWWKMKWANLNSAVAYALSVDATTPEGRGQIWMPNGLHFGATNAKVKLNAASDGGVRGIHYTSSGISNFMGWSTVMPGIGNFRSGDIVWNNGNNSNIGWRFNGSVWQSF